MVEVQGVWGGEGEMELNPQNQSADPPTWWEGEPPAGTQASPIPDTISLRAGVIRGWLVLGLVSFLSHTDGRLVL